MPIIQTFSICQILVPPLSISIRQSGYSVSNGYLKTQLLLQLPDTILDVSDPDLLFGGPCLAITES